MIKKESPVHVLSTMRKRCKMSQSKLARLAGCSLPTIKQIERGRLRPSAGLAHRIYMQTGLNPEQIMNNVNPEEPLGVTGEPFTEENFTVAQAEMQKGHRAYETQEQIDEDIRFYAAVLTLVLDASIREGKIWAFRPALKDAINRLIKDFELESDLRRFLAERFQLKTPWYHAGLRSLYTIINAKPFEKDCAQAELKRREFFELLKSKTDRILEKQKQHSLQRDQNP